MASGINDSGQVVGYTDTVMGARAFLWDNNNGMQDIIGTLPGDNGSEAYAINDAGQVVGVSWNSPEPATLSLLALGGLAVLRRRR